jgi:hypothetical protein
MDFRGRDGSLTHLVGMSADDLAEILMECDASSVLGALLDELGAPAMTRWLGDTGDEAGTIHRLCRGLSRGYVPSEIHELERTGREYAIAEAIVHGLDWSKDTQTQPLFQALEVIR